MATTKARLARLKAEMAEVSEDIGYEAFGEAAREFLNSYFPMTKNCALVLEAGPPGCQAVILTLKGVAPGVITLPHHDFTDNY